MFAGTAGLLDVPNGRLSLSFLAEIEWIRLGGNSRRQGRPDLVDTCGVVSFTASVVAVQGRRDVFFAGIGLEGVGCSVLEVIGDHFKFK